MTPEGKVKQQIKRILKDSAVYWCMPMGTGYGNSGVPDFICCVNGHFLGIEAKAGKGTTTLLQDANIERIHSAGGSVLIINETNVNKLKEVLCTMQTPEQTKPTPG
jgi:Holliday junction resolvase